MAHLSALPHSELEKEAPALKSRDDSVSGESCFLEVMPGNMKHAEELQYLCAQLSRVHFPLPKPKGSAEGAIRGE
jgi:hypothetical protein